MCKDKSFSWTKSHTYLLMFLGWFTLYMYCGYLTSSKYNIDLIRASLNVIMTIIVLWVTFTERYKVMKAEREYKNLVKSDELFLALGLSLVPFAAAMSDLGRANSSFNAAFATLMFFTLISLAETIVILALIKKATDWMDFIWHAVLSIVLVLCAIITTPIGLVFYNYVMSRF